MRVKEVRRILLEKPVPVYDFAVHGTENFKLANGPFVHNSKDIADALAGVVYGLTVRREIWAMYGIPLMKIPTTLSLALAKPKAGEQ